MTALPGTMVLVDVSEHIESLRHQGLLLAAAASAAGLSAPVPSCPEWDVRDLVRHVGGVHRWATGIVSAPGADLKGADLDEVVGTWPDDPDLLAWFGDGHAQLVSALAGADPDLECWTFLPAPSPLAMWSRRQAHETAMHRVDAELAAGVSSVSCPPELAVDGIDELLTCFVPRPRTRLRADPPRTLRVRCVDMAASWVVEISPDGVKTSVSDGEGDAGRESDADCEVSGAASDLYLALWNRRDLSGLVVRGDAAVLGNFREFVHVRW
jgi:uncharacterized protein (TIGR03083 family)